MRILCKYMFSTIKSAHFLLETTENLFLSLRRRHILKPKRAILAMQIEKCYGTEQEESLPLSSDAATRLKVV